MSHVSKLHRMSLFEVVHLQHAKREISPLNKKFMTQVSQEASHIFWPATRTEYFLESVVSTCLHP